MTLPTYLLDSDSDALTGGDVDYRDAEFNGRSCTEVANLNVLFIVDNSGSISDFEFDQFSNAISTVGDELIANDDRARVAVAHFGGPWIEDYDEFGRHVYIERDFSRDPLAAPTRIFSRNAYPDYYMDNMAGAMEEFALLLDGTATTTSSKVVSPISEMDHRAGDAAHVVLFTDAAWDYFGDSAVVDYDGPNGDWDIYDQFKENGWRISLVRVQFTANQDKFAAIASMGGSYSGLIAGNPNDPEGVGEAPRLFYPTADFDFTELTTDIVAGVTAPCMEEISGQAWNDLDSDGLRDSGEPPMEGVLVRIYNHLDELLAQQVTDSNGSYAFTAEYFSEIGAGYYLEFIEPDSFTLAPQDVGFDDTIDSDPNQLTKKTDLIIATSATNIDAGFIAASFDRGDAPVSYGDSYNQVASYINLWLGSPSSRPDTEAPFFTYPTLDGLAPEISFSLSEQSFLTTDSLGQVELQLSQASLTPVTVTLRNRTVDGQESLYGPPNGTIVEIPAGQTAATVSWTIEPLIGLITSYEFTLSLENYNGVLPGLRTSTKVTISEATSGAPPSGEELILSNAVVASDLFFQTYYSGLPDITPSYVLAQTLETSATADDESGVDDEDGVTFNGSESPGDGIVYYLNQTYTLDLKIYNKSFDQALVEGWIDFDGNGIFDDSDKILRQVVGRSAAAQTLSGTEFTVPYGAACGGTYARFRISDRDSGSASGFAGWGETEDYYLFIDCKTDLETEVNISPSGDLELSEFVTLEVIAINNGPNPAREMTVTFDYPIGLESVSLIVLNDWVCDHDTGLGTVTCTKSGLNANENEAVLEITGRIPGIYQPDTLAGRSTVTHEEFDHVMGNDETLYGVNVDKEWVGEQGLFELFLHARYDEDLGFTIDNVTDFRTGDIIQLPLQSTLEHVVGLEMTTPPTLTTNFCATASGAPGCNQATDNMTGTLAIQAYTTLSINEVTENESDFDVTGPNLIDTPVRIELGGSANERYAEEVAADCQAWHTAAGGNCVTYYDLYRSMVGAIQDRYQWSPEEFSSIAFQTPGGRNITCDSAIGTCYLLQNSKPGLYMLAGELEYDILYYDPIHERLGSPEYRETLTIPYQFFINVIVTFTEGD